MKITYKSIYKMQDLQKKLDTFNYVYDAMNSDYEKMKTAKISNTEQMKLYLRMKELFDKDINNTFNSFVFYINLVSSNTNLNPDITEYEDKHFRQTLNHYCI